MEHCRRIGSAVLPEPEPSRGPAELSLASRVRAAKPYLIFCALNILQYIFYSTPLPLATLY